MDIDEQLLIACCDGHLVLVAMLLKLGADPSSTENRPIVYATIKGHTEIVRLLLADDRVDPSDNENWAIDVARENGHTEIVQLLQEDPRVRKKDTV